MRTCPAGATPNSTKKCLSAHAPAPKCLTGSAFPGAEQECSVENGHAFVKALNTLQNAHAATHKQNLQFQSVPTCVKP